MSTLQYESQILALRARARIFLQNDQPKSQSTHLNEIERNTSQTPFCDLFSSVSELFIAGGGGAGRALPSALEEAAAFGLDFEKVKVVCATSVGTMVGLAIVLGIPPQEMKAILNQMPTDRFQDWSVKKIFNFFREWGLCSGKEIAIFIQKLIEEKTGLEDPTFLELYEAGYTKEFRVLTTNVSKLRTAIFSYKQTPHKRVSDVIATACSIPLVYSPHWIVNDFGELEAHTDGGLIRNYPFGFGGATPSPIEHQLGFNFVNKGAAYGLDNDKHQFVSSFWQYFKNLLAMILFQDPVALPDGIRDRTVIISVNHNPLNFNASEDEQTALDKAGKKGVQNLVHRIHHNNQRKEAMEYHRNFLQSFEKHQKTSTRLTAIKATQNSTHSMKLRKKA
ncbi:MAG: patatin-like phospholipase family protein [Gammaproteobacteria bacterium]|jgi:patatin-like phospholipase/acyl hydrolase|nr:patatin-like phospholipase family protein [Gammaproteobacteria bacterium]